MKIWDLCRTISQRCLKSAKKNGRPPEARNCTGLSCDRRGLACKSGVSACGVSVFYKAVFCGCFKRLLHLGKIFNGFPFIIFYRAIQFVFNVHAIIVLRRLFFYNYRTIQGFSMKNCIHRKGTYNKAEREAAAMPPSRSDRG